MVLIPVTFVDNATLYSSGLLQICTYFGIIPLIEFNDYILSTIGQVFMQDSISDIHDPLEAE